MKNLIRIIILLSSLLFIVSCASTPEETPQPDPVIEEEVIEVQPEPVVEEPEIVEEEPVVQEEPIVEETIVEPEVEVILPEPLDEELLLKARKDIFRAEEARADTYYPKRLNELKDLLKEANNIKLDDPDKARELLSTINDKIYPLIKDSLEALKIACIDILSKQSNKLLKIEADKYTPKEYQQTQNKKDAAIFAFKNSEISESLALYRTAYTAQENLYNSVTQNMSAIENLLRLINNYKAEGEAIEVQEWAQEEYQRAVNSYLKSQELIYKAYDAINGEASLRETLFLAKKAIEQAKINIEVAETDSEIFDLMSELENASTLTVLDEDDNIISPEEWKGEANLKSKPIEAEVEKDEESVLKPIDLEQNVEVEYPIESGETGVLGISEQRRSLLEEAKELWALGIEARNSGDLLKAREYLAKSKVYLEEYKAMAVDYIYTVVLNPDLRDCLWRISEKDEFYGDPLLWKNIWERNKKLIQDPDLIYPGWKLIIPPLE